MFGIGGFELVLILLFGFIIFGDKLPDIAKTAGQAIGKFRKAQEKMSGKLSTEIFDKDSDAPFKNPLDVIDNAADKAQKGATQAKKAAGEAAEKMESFAERKARYDRERAERKAAEKAAAEAAAAADVAENPKAQVADKTISEAADAPAPSASSATEEKGE